MPVLHCDPAVARERLEAAGIDVDPGNTKYELWRVSHGDAIAVAYEDKIVLQGSNPHDLRGYLEPDAAEQATLYFDGASRGNPGPSGIGWVLEAEGRIVAEHGEQIGRATNNQAEWEALIAGIEAAQSHGLNELDIRGDSELIVKQLRGEYDTNDPQLRECRARARELLTGLDSWSVTHVPRGLNDRADELANEALDD